MSVVANRECRGAARRVDNDTPVSFCAQWVVGLMKRCPPPQP
jgi:hypothetical protein